MHGKGPQTGQAAKARIAAVPAGATLIDALTPSDWKLEDASDWDISLGRPLRQGREGSGESTQDTA